ncbi:MAG: hypothetical protein KH372_02745 [Olsenella uli]|uniref:FtsK/SpoIIIE domain-containing protein n=1 Tax=Olsenella uli TaxID=133926 RepID=UPI001DAE18E5|nr:FtsK/SpoIIIE domain-containing protein [Olsenella uli]MBS6417729.1 hypothetical protein [Olsenella uli]
MVYGAVGSGAEGLLGTVVYSLACDHGADELGIYVIDLGSELLGLLSPLPQVGDVALSGEDEKVARLLDMPEGEVERRRRALSSMGVGYAALRSGDAPLSTEVRKDSHGRLVPGSLTFDLTGDDSVGPVLVSDGKKTWAGVGIKGPADDGIEGESQVLLAWQPVGGYSAVRATATVSKGVGAASASVTDTETLEWGVKDPVTGVRLDGVLMPSASTSPAPSTHTNALRLPDAQEVGEGAVVVGGTVVVGVVAYKALKALAGFALAGPPGALAGALAP